MQAANQYDGIRPSASQRRVGVEQVETRMARLVVGVFEPDDAGLVGVALFVDSDFGELVRGFSLHQVGAEYPVGLLGVDAVRRAAQRGRKEKSGDESFHCLS